MGRWPGEFMILSHSQVRWGWLFSNRFVGHNCLVIGGALVQMELMAGGAAVTYGLAPMV